MQALREVDWIGSALIVGGTILFLLGLEDGAGLYGWGSARVICLLVFGILLLAAFCGFEAKISNPLIPLRIFSSATNIAAVAVTCLQSFIFIAFDYFLPLYMQVVTRLSPIISGVSLFAMVLPLSFCSTLAGFYVKKTGDYFWPTVLAATVMAVGTGLFVDFGTQRSWAKIICFLAVAGMGTGPIFQTPVIALQSNTRPDDLTAAMSALTFLRSLCTSVSIVVGSVILQAQLGKGSLSYTPTEKTDTERRAYVAALRIMWIFYTAVSVTMICSTFFINRTKVQDATGGDSPKTEGETGGVTELTSDKRPSSDTGSPRRVEPVV
jgi:fucose permease